MVVSQMNTESWAENYSIPEDIDTFYNIEVEHPTHIPLIVEVIGEISKEKPVIAGLDHREQEYSGEFPGHGYDGRHAMRGGNEQISSNLEPGTNLFKRTDGGYTVYTDDTKFCEILGLPLEEQDQKKASELTDWYLGELAREIESLEETDLTIEDRDLYSGNNQIIGTATKFRENSVTTRSYWAEKIPGIYDLMAKDGATWGEMMRHRENMRESERLLGENSLYQKRIERYDSQDITSSNFLEENLDLENLELPYTLLEEEEGMPRKICFT
jgi:hypothetical protein